MERASFEGAKVEGDDTGDEEGDEKGERVKKEEGEDEAAAGD
jgi:hypothetical protein